jgi:hypothetical protein
MTPLWEKYYVEAIINYKSICNIRFEEDLKRPNNEKQAIENLKIIEQRFESVASSVQRVTSTAIIRIEGFII